MPPGHPDASLQKPAAATVAFTLNDRPVRVQVDPQRSLLSVLRDELDILSPKNGCEPQGQCGCCTVLVDGKPRLSCRTPVANVHGRRVATAEGLPAELRQQVAECFVRAGGVQCGFCIPGIVMRAVVLLQNKPQPSRSDIAGALKGHLCRCTGYTKIIDAIELLGQVRLGRPLPDGDTSGRVGTRLDRYRGHELVLGDFRYVDDLRAAGCLYAALRFSDHPRALVQRIDVAPAMAVAGVERVITAASVPGDRYVGLIERDWPVLVAAGEETRYVGDILAIVVATDQRTARAAADRITVAYDVRTPIVTPEDALKPDAPRIHPNGNVLSRSVIRRGNVGELLASSAHVVRRTFATQMIEHMYLEPEACLAQPELGADGAVRTLKVYSQGQGVFDDRRQIASVLGWDAERVRVELVSNGGAFGGKEDMSIQAQTALAAALCAQPVKCTLTRAESFRLHPKRHPIAIDITAGCDADGRLTAVRARMIGDTGAYASVGAKVLERAAGHATGPYRVPAIDVEALAVYTNNPPCGAMRGFGVPQAAFAIEGCLDLLAEKVGIDGWEIRWRNALDVGDRFCTGQIMSKPIGLRRTLLAVRDAYRGAKYAGIACGIKNVGIGNGLPDVGKALLRVELCRDRQRADDPSRERERADDLSRDRDQSRDREGAVRLNRSRDREGAVQPRVVIRTGFTEMGQGYFTICVQAACQETGLPPDVFVPVTDTSADLDCGQTTASRATVLGAAAIADAARKLRADLDAGRSLTELVGREYRGEYACTDTVPLGTDVPDPKTHLTYGFATQVVILDDDGRIGKVIAAHDVGRVMNPTLLEGQIEGSIHMGLGYALTEEFLVRDGQIESKDIRSLGVLRAHQMPAIEIIFIEEADPETAYGARGVGEIGMVPTAAAVAGALAAFDGSHRTALPMKDSPAARALVGRQTQTA